MQVRRIVHACRIAVATLVMVGVSGSMTRAQPAACSQLHAAIQTCQAQTNACSNMTNQRDKQNCLLLADQAYKQCLTSQQNISAAYKACVKANGG